MAFCTALPHGKPGQVYEPAFVFQCGVTFCNYNNSVFIEKQTYSVVHVQARKNNSNDNIRVRFKTVSLFLPPPKVIFLVPSVCLSVRRITEKNCERILTKFLGGVGHGPGTNGFNFGDDLVHCPDPGVRSPKSAFTGLSKMLPTDFDEFFWRAGMWPRDQLITFW